MAGYGLGWDVRIVLRGGLTGDSRRCHRVRATSGELLGNARVPAQLEEKLELGLRQIFYLFISLHAYWLDHLEELGGAGSRCHVLAGCRVELCLNDSAQVWRVFGGL